MKKANLKRLLPIMLISLFIIILGVLAITTTVISPAADKYILHPAGNMTFTCQATPTSGTWNITNVSIWYWNETGSKWYYTGFSNTTNQVNGTAVNMTIAGHGSDGTSQTWRCQACERNTSDLSVSCVNSSTSRTVYFERPPSVKLVSPSPAASDYNDTAAQTIGLNVTSTYTSTSTFNCQIYYNSTSSNWTTDGRTFTVSNSTAYTTIAFTFSEGHTNWGAKCWETGNSNAYNWSVNRTFILDTVSPSVTVLSPSDGEWFNLDYNVKIRLNVTDLNADSCILKTSMNKSANTSGNYNSSFETKSYTTKTAFYFNTFNGTGINWTDDNTGAYKWAYWCNDSAGNTASSSNYSFYVDSDTPTIDTVTNQSISGYCDVWEVNWTSSDENGTNFTMAWGTTSGAADGSTSSASFTVEDVGNMTSYTDETTYYINITIWDRAGNKNETAYTVVTPLGICTGWNWRTVLTNSMTMGNLVDNITNVDYVYWFNQTSQAWKYATPTVRTYENLTIYNGTAVAIYDAGNSTWQRTTNNFAIDDANLAYSLISGDNFVGSINRSFTFWNWTNLESGCTNCAGFNKSILYYATYNNTDNGWESYYYNGTWGNTTVFGRMKNTEVVWFYSAYNITWNGTALS